jgi:hypothetical protein
MSELGTIDDWQGRRALTNGYGPSYGERVFNYNLDRVNNMREIASYVSELKNAAFREYLDQQAAASHASRAS